jgi:hypothetical protein
MWGLRPKVVHWQYDSIIRPSMTLAYLVWWPGCQMASPKQRLRRIQRLACLGITGAASVMGALTCLLSLELLVRSAARSDAHRLWSLGCWSYLQPNRGHSSILMRLQLSDHVFNMEGVDIIRPVFNLEPKYTVTMLTREEWTR